jgi:hypothetical protein
VVYAGTFAGAISGVDDKGLPLSANCTTCHNGTIAADQFTPWRATGHAEIFAQNLNTRIPYGESCFECHTVGFNKDVKNGGVDDAADYAAFVASLPTLTASPDNWKSVVSKYPNVAKLGNIQCENCHGPNDASTLHMNGKVDPERVSIAAGVCGVCHGEPPRHGRFQQWEASLHGDVEMAMEEAGSSSCARCHTGQGYLMWLKQGDMTKSIQGANGNATAAELTARGLSAQTAQPITCAVCHDPHDIGTTSSAEPNNAKVRVMDDTPMLPSGWKATGVGRGAVCFTCHNTRNGAHNDVALPTMDDRAPHVPAQGDVIMGQNAYFVTVGQRSPHSYIKDTCATCHMELTAPPAGYSATSTNHSFTASVAICTSCHGAYDGGGIQKATEANLEDLKLAIEKAIAREISDQIKAGNEVVLLKLGAGGADVVITDASTVTVVEFLESHGRQAVELKIGDTTYDVRLATDTATRPAGSSIATGKLVSSANGQNIAKAGWNYFLLHGDASKGVHNPTFTNDVINASLAALK